MTSKYAPTSMTGLTETSQLRQICVKLQANPYFKAIITLVVIANAIIIALTDFSDVDVHGNIQYNSPRNQAIRSSDPFLVSVFVFEAIIKMIAMGLYSTEGRSYLSDGWNILDVIVAIAA